MKELNKVWKNHHVTHLVIDGRIPEHLDRLVPSLTHLNISNLHRDDHPKLER